MAKYGKEFEQISGFFEVLIKRMKEAQTLHSSHIEKLNESIALMRVDLKNQLQTNLNYSHQNMLLRSKERAFMDIITEAKSDHQTFSDKFRAA